jgi:hypothetical protein
VSGLEFWCLGSAALCSFALPGASLLFYGASAAVCFRPAVVLLGSGLPCLFFVCVRFGCIGWLGSVCIGVFWRSFRCCSVSLVFIGGLLCSCLGLCLPLYFVLFLLLLLPLHVLCFA